MRVPWGFLAKWAVLTAAAVALGGSLGAFYALEVQGEGADLDAARGHGGEELEPDDIPPTTPEPQAPGDGEVINTTTPTFRWSASEDPLPVLYVLQFGADPEFLVEVGGVRNLYGTEWQTPDEHAFTPGAPVFWHVKAIDIWGNESPWSEVQKFVPAGTPPGTPAPLNA